MFCPNCGAQVEGKFCPECGTRLEAGGSAFPASDAFSASAPGGVNPGYVPAQGYNPGYQDRGSYVPPQGGCNYPAAPLRGGRPGYAPAAPVNVETPARAAARRLLSSPLFLAALILLTLTVILGCVNTARSIPAIQAGTSARDAAAGRLVVWVALGFVALIYGLALGGMWLSYGSALRRESPISTAGFGMVKASLILLVVLLVMGLLLLAVLAFGMTASGALDILEQGEDKVLRDLQEFLRLHGLDMAQTPFSLRALFALLMGILVLAEALALLLMAKLMKTVNVVKYVIRSGNPDDRVSMLVLVYCVLAVIGGVGTGVSMLTQDQLLLALSSFLGSGSMGCFALLLYRWRDSMQSLGVYKGVTRYGGM